ncbi:MAG: ABC transporter permease [Spirochaetaceae bacterium]|jgi:peptide/nickel transport system permease protein|nr:ABC transporter permease [Spirochaetaceae bacterium]
MNINLKNLPPAGVCFSVAVLAIVFLWALFPGVFAAGALEQDVNSGSLPAFSNGHIFGTDALGRDVFKLMIAGARSAIIGPLVIALGSLVIGLAAGSIAGFRGGIIDWIISRYTDLTLALPSMLLAIVAAGVIGGGYWVSVAVLIVLYSPYDIRLVRSAVMAEKSKNYIEAAFVLRISTARILIKHIFPNIAVIVFVNFFLNIAYALVAMSALSFLGVGVSPAAADWGRQLSDARAIIFENPAASLSVGLAIIITSISINVAGSYITERRTLDS